MTTAATGTKLTAAVPRRGPVNNGALEFPAVGKPLMTKILLIEDDGETAEEIAAELGCPLGTALSHCRRGLAAMKKLLTTNEQ